MKQLSEMKSGKYIAAALVIFSMVFSSCKEKQVVNSGLSQIALKKSRDILPISSFVADLDYLELKINKTSIELGDIINIKEFDNDLIIQQRRANEISFLKFTGKGEFVNTIVSNKGGRGRISKPLDVILFNNEYAVLAEDGIYVVGKSGKFKTKLISAKMPGSKFFESKGRFYVANDVPDSGLYTVYLQNKKSKLIHFPEERLRELGRSNLAAFATKNIKLVSSYSDTVYAYNNTTFTPEYIIQSDAYPTFAEVWRNIDDKNDIETLKYLHNTQHSRIKSYFENSNYIFLTYWQGSYQTTALIKKNSWKTLYFAEAVNNIDGGIWENPSFLSQNDELYIPITPYKAGGHKILDKRHNDFEKIQLHIAASGNPVIMRCKLK